MNILVRAACTPPLTSARMREYFPAPNFLPITQSHTSCPAPFFQASLVSFPSLWRGFAGRLSFFGRFLLIHNLWIKPIPAESWSFPALSLSFESLVLPRFLCDREFARRSGFSEIFAFGWNDLWGLCDAQACHQPATNILGFKMLFFTQSNGFLYGDSLAKHWWKWRKVSSTCRFLVYIFF